MNFLSALQFRRRLHFKEDWRKVMPRKGLAWARATKLGKKWEGQINRQLAPTLQGTSIVVLLQYLLLKDLQSFSFTIFINWKYYHCNLFYNFYHRHYRDYVDALKAFPRSRQASDEESSAKMSSLLLSAPLSILLIPSLKEVIFPTSFFWWVKELLLNSESFVSK